MFIPLHDANSLKHIRLQYVTLGLIAANVIVWLLTSSGSEQATYAAMCGLGYIPASDTGYCVDLVALPPGGSYLSYTFLHGDFWHLAGNMLFLWVFGDNVEDALGHIKFLIFYILCGAAAAWFHGFVAPSSEAPLIGASGSISGIVIAYLILHPKVKLWVLVFMRIPLRIPAWIAIVAWIGFQIFMFFSAGEDNVSWAAHLGGMVAGALLVPLLKRRSVPLFDREIKTPDAVEVASEPAKPAQSRRWGRQ